MEKMLTVRELQALWGLSQPTAYRLVHSEGFPVIRVGTKILIPSNRLDEWVEKQLQEDKNDAGDD